MNKPKSRKKAGMAPGPERADWHNADIKAALDKAGWSLRQLSIHHGLTHTAFQKALMHPYPRAEQAIADVIGIPPQEIWPSRYNAEGQPIRQKRGKKPRIPSHGETGQSSKSSPKTESLAEEGKGGQSNG